MNREPDPLRSGIVYQILKRPALYKLHLKKQSPAVECVRRVYCRKVRVGERLKKLRLPKSRGWIRFRDGIDFDKGGAVQKRVPCPEHCCILPRNKWHQIHILVG